MNMKADNIVGHQKVLGLISGVIQSKNVAHAYLFLGARQVGKETVARWFARQLIFDKVARKYNLSVLRSESGIKIGDIRSLQHELSLTNPFGGPRVVILGDIDDMSIPAQNAFLKILEEPQTNVIFILLARRLQALLPTIISRAQLIRLSPVAVSEISNYLRSKGLDIKTATEVARLSRGCPGRAHEFLRSESGTGKLTEPAARFIDILTAPIFKRWNYAKEISEGNAVSSWIGMAEGVLRDCLLCKQGRDSDMNYLSLADKIMAIMANHDIQDFKNALRGLNILRDQLQKNINVKLALENYFINFLPLNTKI